MTRRIVWSEYVSLDGVVDEPGQWSIPYFSDDLAEYKSDELLASDALLLGRITYEGFAAAWPTMEEVEGDFAVRMITLPKYVAYTRLKSADWNNSTIIRENVPDEVRMLVHPITVGTGKRLFEGANDSVALALVATQSFDSGVVALTYRAVG